MADRDIRTLIWDDWNVAYIKERHDVTPDMVEGVCYGNPRNLKAEDTHTDRYRIIGPRQDGKLLVIILAPEGEHTYYVVTARPPKRQEIRRYRDWKAGTIV